MQVTTPCGGTPAAWAPKAVVTKVRVATCGCLQRSACTSKYEDVGACKQRFSGGLQTIESPGALCYMDQ